MKTELSKYLSNVKINTSVFIYLKTLNFKRVYFAFIKDIKDALEK